MRADRGGRGTPIASGRCRLVPSEWSLVPHRAGRCTLMPRPAAFLEAREYSSLAERGGGLEIPKRIPNSTLMMTACYPFLSKR